MNPSDTKKVNDEHIAPKGSKFLYYGLLTYTVIFFSQIAGRFPILDPLRIELVIGSILIVFAMIKIITGEVNFKENGLNSAASFFIIAALITIPFAAWRMHALETFERLLKFFAIYLMIIASIDDEKKLKGFVFVYLCMITLLFIEPFFLSLQGNGFIYNNHMWRLAGVTGYFQHPNGLGGLTSANLPFFYYLVKYGRSKLVKILCLSLIIISLRVIMLTQSRTAFVGLIAFGFFVFLFSRKKILSLILILISSVLIWNFAPQETKDRFLTFRNVDEVISGEMTQEEGGSMGARWTLMKHSLIVFIENPIIGVGLDNFKVVSFNRWHYWIPPHNTYLQALAEMGLIGFIAFLSVIIATFKNLSESKKILTEAGHKDSFVGYVNSAVLLYLIVQLVVSFFGIELYGNYWWIAGGLSLVLLRIGRSEVTVKRLKKPLETF